MQATSVQPGQQVRLAQVTIIIFPFNRKDELDRETRNMAALLAKFRIDFSSVLVIPGINHHFHFFFHFHFLFDASSRCDEASK